METDVLIIGGGITGLTTAHALTAAPGGASYSFLLVERDARLGGLIHTDQEDGFLLEAGPDSFLTAEPWALDLCRDLALAHRLIRPQEHPSSLHVVRRGRVEPVPADLIFGIPRRYGPLLRSRLFSSWGKIRMALEPLIPPRLDPGDESVAAFLRRRLGREAYERLAGPLFGTVYGTDPELLSLEALAPKLAHLERTYGSLVRGLRSMDRDGKVAPSGVTARSPMVSLRGGMGELIHALVRNLPGGRLLTRAPAERLWPHPGKGWEAILGDGLRIQSRAVVLALPPGGAARLVQSWNGRLAATLDSLPTRTAATLHLGFHRRQVGHPLKGHGLLFPVNEKRRLPGVTWTSSKWPGRAPQDHVLLRCIVSSSWCPDLPAVEDPRLVELCLEDLREVLGIIGEPILTRVFRFPRLIPQLTVGHLTRLAAARAELGKTLGLFLAGNGYRGAGIPDCIRDARQTALAVGRFLFFRGPPQPPGPPRPAGRPGQKTVPLYPDEGGREP